MNRAFRVLWLSQSVSYVGSQVTVVALPLAAALELNAGPTAMGVLTALGRLPYLFLALPVGVVVDRVSRGRLLLASNVMLAIVLVAIPIADVGGWLDGVRHRLDLALLEAPR